MIEINKSLPLSNLKNLNIEQIAITSNPKGGFLAFLDFENEFALSSEKIDECLEELEKNRKTNKLSFSGWIGFFGYEFLAKHLGLKLKAKRDLDVSDGWFGRPQTIIHLLPQSTNIESTISGREEKISILLNFSNIYDVDNVNFPAKSQNCNLDFLEYEKIFNLAREAILDGESYQIKISQRYEAEVSIDPIIAFHKLCLANPAPEAFLLKTKNFAIVSCSPEIVIEKNENILRTRPIGGTYERKKKENTHSVIERFLNDQKEVAEHNMLVDLERNDLSTVCKPGTVRLTRFREVETYAHLHHLVSTIEGSLKEDVHLSEILAAMLPGGSITGCPKIRTMELIDDLEPCFRGPYTGSFGTISDDGSISLNIIIRSMLILDKFCYTQSGGGIVVDSTAEYEYNENNLKARALLELLS